MKKLSNLRTWTTEKLSQRMFYVLLGLIVVVFLLFFFIGFDEPFIDDPNFNEPLFTDVVIYLMWFLLFIALGVGIISLIRAIRTDSDSEDETNNVPEKKIKRIVVLGTTICLIITFLVASTAAMDINGKKYVDWIGLKLSDMFIYTSILMLIVAAGAAAFGATKYIRKGGK